MTSSKQIKQVWPVSVTSSHTAVMVRSVPEKTFEHWVSRYVANRFPRSSLWWPTKGEDVRVTDLGVGVGKAILLEVKVPEQQANGSHKVSIDVSQLRRYQASPVPVYYVFPQPPWSGSLEASAWLGREGRAELAYRRSGRRWFGHWSVVCRADHLLSHLAPAPTSKLQVMSSPPTVHWYWQSFWQWFAACGAGVMPAAYILDRPLPYSNPAQLRGYLRSRAEEGSYGLAREELLAQRRFVYVPEPDAPDESGYRLVEEEDLNEVLAGLHSTDEEEGDHLGVCGLPLVHLHPA